jgi:hypothetical protein
MFIGVLQEIEDMVGQQSADSNQRRPDVPIARQRASEATSKHAISAQASHGDAQIWRKRRATLGENNTRRLPDELVRMHRSHRAIKGFLHFRFAWLLVDLNWADMGQNLHAFAFPRNAFVRSRANRRTERLQPSERDATCAV